MSIYHNPHNYPHPRHPLRLLPSCISTQPPSTDERFAGLCLPDDGVNTGWRSCACWRANERTPDTSDNDTLQGRVPSIAIKICCYKFHLTSVTSSTQAPTTSTASGLNWTGTSASWRLVQNLYYSQQSNKPITEREGDVEGGREQVLRISCSQ